MGGSGYPDRDELRDALRDGDVTASFQATTRLRDQFRDSWHDVLVALCRHLADTHIPARVRQVSIRDPSGAGLVMHGGQIVTEVYFGQRNTRVHIWSDDEIRAPFTTGAYRVSRKLQERLSSQLGPAWEHDLASLAATLAPVPSALAADPTG